MKNPIQQLFGQTAVYGFGIVLPRFLNYLLTPFYTRIFVPSDYGAITELYGYVVFLLVVLTYGMETGYFRYASNSPREEKVYSTGLISLFVSSLAFVFIIYSTSDGLSRAMGYGEHPEYIRWLALIVSLDAFTALPFARMRLQNKAVKYAVIRVVEVLVNIGLNVFFLLYCKEHVDSQFIQKVYNPDIGLGYVLISNVVASLVKLVLLTGEILAVRIAWFQMVLWRVLVRYSYPLLIAGLAGAVNEALDRVLLKHLIPEAQFPMEQVGIYGANMKMAVLMTLFVQMFKYAAEPFFFSRARDGNAKQLYADVMTFFVLACLFIFLVVTFFLDSFILIIGKDFREGLHIVPVVLLANLVMGIFFSLSIWYKLTNKNKIGAVLVLIGASITVVVNVVFVPRWGYTAAAWAHLVCYSVMVVLSYQWSRKTYPVPYRIGRILGYFGLALSLYGVNALFLRQMERGGTILAVVLLILFVLVAYVREKSTFNTYAHG
ncbi:MAG: polysaccharide biosynthesis C-terminal domain-containing protein [Bacteroidales bacterium]